MIRPRLTDAFAVDDAVVDGHLDRQPLGIVDHRRAEALAQLSEIGAKRHVSRDGRREVALNGGDRHDPVVRIAKVSSGLLGLHLAGALHQHARDDLEAVGDPMLHLLQKDRLLAKEIVLFAELRRERA